MGSGDKPKIAIISSELDYSGMIAAAILEENVDPVGVIYDNGRPPRKQGLSGAASRWRRLYMHARLAVVLPAWYARKMTQRLGINYPTPYQQKRRHGRAGFPTLDEVAARDSVPFHSVENINSEESVELLNGMQPDIVAALGTRIIKGRVLDTARLGFLNGHSSLLPDYRGSAAEFWQLANAEPKTGVTVHWMKQRVDQGDIVAQEEWPIDLDSSHLQMRIDSQYRRVAVWQRAVRNVIDGNLGTPQGPSKTPTFRKPKLEDFYDHYVRQR